MSRKTLARRILSATVILCSPCLGLETVYELSPFQVDASGDVGYLSTNSVSGTSLNRSIRDLPMTIQVVNEEFIRDIGATDMEEALAFTAGVFTSNAAATSDGASSNANRAGGSAERSASAGAG